MLTKLNALILGCIFLFVTPLIASAQSDQLDQMLGPQSARVIVPRAIVYSDENMNSPLGFISNDKIITVGNPRKRNPDLLPIVVYGRLAFIEAKNIHYTNETIEALSSKRGAPREHNIDLILAKPEEKMTENNSAYFSLNRFSAGEESKNLVETVDGSTSSSFTGLGISLIHRQIPGRVFWGAGYEYNNLSTDNFKFDLYLLGPIIGYTPIRNPLFLVDLIFTLDLSVSAIVKISNNNANEPYGFVYGPHLGARMVFFPNQKYHAFGTIGYRSYKVTRLGTLEDSNGQPISGITKINGINLSIGFAIEI